MGNKTVHCLCRRRRAPTTGQHATKHVTFELVLQVAIVADERWGYMLVLFRRTDISVIVLFKTKA